MGAYLSKPITKKFSSDEVGTNVAVGASSMQGWRISQEDAHNCCINFDKDVSLFAVYDGHGGREVASYCARNLPDFIKQTEAYKRGDIRQALIDAFLGFDATLAQPDVINILKKLAGASTSDDNDPDLDDTDEEENVSNLRLEATMPLDQVIAKYRSEVSSPHIKKTNNERSSKGTCSYIRGRKTRDKDTCLASGASCSSSSSSSFLSSTVWNTNEADVSSSSQPCGSTSSNTMTKGREFLGNNEAEQVLDSTSSNDNLKGASISRIGSTVDSAKSVDMPDSSEDVTEKVSSPSKETRVDSDANEVELNGMESKRITDADSSKGGNDNVSSSSSSPSEIGKQESKKSDDEQQHDDDNNAAKHSDYAFSERLRYRKGTDNNDEDKSDGNGENNKDDEVSIVEEELDDEDEDDDDYDEDEDGNIDDDEDDQNDDDDEDDEDDEDAEDDDDDEDENNETSLTNLEEPGSDSGCTAVVAILKNNELYVANAGDSRCVLCRDGQALELSLDHKPEDEPEMERIVKAGGKVTADGRVNGGLNLSRALGDHAYKKNTVLPPQEQMISALPDIRHVTIEPERDEFMVLACDGIWNFMSSQEVINFVRARLADKYDNISKICEELFDYCLAPDTFGDGTGCDNMTAVIVRFKAPNATTLPRPNSSLAETSDSSCAKKRSISPTTLPGGSNDCVTEENNTLQTCKRAKTEAAIEVANETS